MNGRKRIAVARGDRQLLWRIPLAVLTCVAGSWLIAWAVSRAAGFTMNPSLVAVLSAAASAAAIAAKLRGKGKRGPQVTRATFGRPAQAAPS